ncbi:hypothetical protein LR48_Vigan06g088700 [Vigna angularis]|uniref:Uncharacterized protein n=1 Tax=Phaseolus angularis TaxID=3914 RepID=A0A0L9US89_PHAAN|nr:hypothetical protein LR48_Vigan06g088700 [Vigna angularis]
MASSLKLYLFSACVLVVCMVVAAQYEEGDGSSNSGMPNMPNMADGPAPHTSASPTTLTYSAILTVILPFLLTFLAAKDRI